MRTFHIPTKFPILFLYQKIKLEIIYNFTELDFFIVDGPFFSRYMNSLVDHGFHVPFLASIGALLS